MVCGVPRSGTLSSCSRMGINLANISFFLGGYIDLGGGRGEPTVRLGGRPCQLTESQSLNSLKP